MGGRIEHSPVLQGNESQADDLADVDLGRPRARGDAAEHSALVGQPRERLTAALAHDGPGLLAGSGRCHPPGTIKLGSSNSPQQRMISDVLHAGAIKTGLEAVLRSLKLFGITGTTS